MNQYYVVYSKNEKDEKFTVLDAMSLKEAKAVFSVRYESLIDAMEEGESFYFLQVSGGLIFDENNRLVFPKYGELGSIHKL